MGKNKKSNNSDAAINFGEINLVDQDSLNKLIADSMKTREMEYRKEIDALKAELFSNFNMESIIKLVKKEISISKQNKEITELRTEIKKLNANQFELTNKIKQLENENGQLKENANKYQQSVSLINMLSEKTDSMLGSLAYLADEFDQFSTKTTQMEKRSSELQYEVNILGAKFNKLEKEHSKTASQLDDLEQYGRRENLEIHGIPYQQDESTNQIVKQLAKQLKINLDDSQISTSHRLYNKSDASNRSVATGKFNTNWKESKSIKQPPIIVRFANRDKRNEIYNKRKALRPNGSSNRGKIEICENLTSRRKFLLQETKRAKAFLNYQFLWTYQGKIFLRYSPMSRVINVSSLSVLAGLGYSVSGNNIGCDRATDFSVPVLRNSY